MPYSALFPARRAACLLTFLCLLPWSTGCASLAPITVRPEPPPPSLVMACEPGPAWPAGDPVPLGELLDVVREREAAAAECRKKHSALATWAEGVTR